MLTDRHGVDGTLTPCYIASIEGSNDADDAPDSDTDGALTSVRVRGSLQTKQVIELRRWVP